MNQPDDPRQDTTSLEEARDARVGRPRVGRPGELSEPGPGRGQPDPDLDGLLADLGRPNPPPLPAEPPAAPPNPGDVDEEPHRSTLASLLRNVLGALLVGLVATMVALILAQSFGATHIGWLGSDGPGSVPATTSTAGAGSGLAR